MAGGVWGVIVTNQTGVILGMILLQLVVVVIMIRYVLALKKLKRQYHDLLKYSPGQNLDDLLLHLGTRVSANEEALASLDKNLNYWIEQGKCHMQKWALLRYKAFANSGGDQSFSFALLDAEGDGIVLSSICGRDESRIYAKTIKKGKSSYALSSEEVEVIRQALES